MTDPLVIDTRCTWIGTIRCHNLVLVPGETDRCSQHMSARAAPRLTDADRERARAWLAWCLNRGRPPTDVIIEELGGRFAEASETGRQNGLEEAAKWLDKNAGQCGPETASRHIRALIGKDGGG